MVVWFLIILCLLYVTRKNPTSCIAIHKCAGLKIKDQCFAFAYQLCFDFGHSSCSSLPMHNHLLSDKSSKSKFKPLLASQSIRRHLCKLNTLTAPLCLGFENASMDRRQGTLKKFKSSAYYWKKSFHFIFFKHYQNTFSNIKDFSEVTDVRSRCWSMLRENWKKVKLIKAEEFNANPFFLSARVYDSYKKCFSGI